MRLHNLQGQRFSRWTVIERAPNDRNKRTYWLCRCDCGNVKQVAAISLVNKQSKSCGCWNLEAIRTRNAKHHLAHVPEYKIWLGIKKRCENPDCPAFKNYGGRGIAIKFRDFGEFYRHLGPRPAGYSIDRINNDGDYAPGNVRWATRKEQASNTRRNRLVTIDGRTQTFAAWCDERGIKRQRGWARLHYGWSVYEALEVTA